MSAIVSLPQLDDFTTTSGDIGILYPLASTLSYAKLFSSHKSFALALTIAKEPDSYAQALLDPKWLDAMKAKLMHFKPTIPGLCASFLLVRCQLDVNGFIKSS